LSLCALEHTQIRVPTLDLIDRYEFPAFLAVAVEEGRVGIACFLSQILPLYRCRRLWWLLLPLTALNHHDNDQERRSESDQVLQFAVHNKLLRPNVCVVRPTMRRR